MKRIVAAVAFAVLAGSAFALPADPTPQETPLTTVPERSQSDPWSNDHHFIAPPQ